jgi:hypothetical protein
MRNGDRREQRLFMIINVDQKKINLLNALLFFSSLYNPSVAFRGAESAVKVKNFPDRAKISPTISDEKSSLY